jgi:hypothetical protein
VREEGTCGGIWEKMILRATGVSGNCKIVLRFYKDIFVTMCLAAAVTTLWANLDKIDGIYEKEALREV